MYELHKVENRDFLSLNIFTSELYFGSIHLLLMFVSVRPHLIFYLVN